MKLSSAGFIEGLNRGKPSVDMELLAKHADGVIALSGCLASRLCQRLVDGRDGDARAHADDLLQVFGPEDVYFEVQKNGLAAAGRRERGDRADRARGRPAAGGDRRRALPAPRGLPPSRGAALRADEVDARAAEDELRHQRVLSEELEEMATAFAEWPEALPSSVEIAERCDVEIELGKQLIPSYPVPEGRGDERTYLRELVLEGLRERYGDPPPAEAIERMEMELAVVDRMGFNAYFLIVWDFVDYAKRNGVAVGPGRGSAAGSIVAYCLRITDVDPLRYDLLFERFLNPERVSMPDIDIDFSVRGRERVIRYVTEKYGKRLGRADRHLRRDVPARGHARRGARARPSAHGRRCAREADPRPDHGSLTELRGLPEAG